ncbi:MAG: GIY-YIG nuclease family protein [Chloroflexi bacterium]|mgnify:CR=1 FL=1|nr:GIY-YIG nuclease family protein [Chloroflexota bacterium]
MPSDLPHTPGTYILLLRLDQPLTVQVGRLGRFELAPGSYAYVGSAHGPGGLAARVTRHLRTAKRPHWHIDYLTARAPVIALWLDASPARLECVWAGALRQAPGVTVPIARFGASDCACPAHLFRVPDGDLTPLWDALSRPVWISLRR